MERPVITTLAEQQALRVNFRKSRLETMALLTVGMIGAGTVNLVHIADDCGAGGPGLDLSAVFSSMSPCRKTGPPDDCAHHRRGG